MMSPTERSMRGRLAVHTSWANTTDPKARTQPARDAFMRRFEDAVDPDRKLPEAERMRRAESAKKAHYVRLAMKSAAARKAKGGPAKAPQVLSLATDERKDSEQRTKRLS